MSSERGDTIQSPKHGCSVHVRSRKLQNNPIEKTASVNTDENAGIQQVQRVRANTLEKKMRVTFKLSRHLVICVQLTTQGQVNSQSSTETRGVCSAGSLH